MGSPGIIDIRAGGWLVYCTPLYVACAYMLVPIISCTGVLDTLNAIAEKTHEAVVTNFLNKMFKHSCTVGSHACRHIYVGLSNSLSW